MSILSSDSVFEIGQIVLRPQIIIEFRRRFLFHGAVAPAGVARRLLLECCYYESR
ncbi:MAG: hypothetical protein K8R46_13630 [Pirellulales bacterium]|nr:hypothetical protein [Pirellulales bacterium]